jgi:Disulphide bond corrector protein DsbC
VAKRRLLPAAALLLALTLCLQAQQSKVVTVTPTEALTAHRGTTVAQTVMITVKPGYHVNSDKPKDEYIIPLKLTWTDGPLNTKTTVYPKAEEIQVNGQSLTVFTGTFPIHTEFQVQPNAAPGTVTVNGKLKYQACNNEMCLRPVTLDIPLQVTIQ